MEKPEGGGKWAITVELSPGRGPSEKVKQHRIASNECLWEDERRHYVGNLWRADSKYQIDSAFERERTALQVRLLTKTFSR